MDALYEIMRVLIRQPFWALVPAVSFLAASWTPKFGASRVVRIAGVVWAVYGLWETAVFFWTRAQPEGGGTPIRVDLLVLGPALLLLTLAALVALVRGALAQR